MHKKSAIFTQFLRNFNANKDNLNSLKKFIFSIDFGKCKMCRIGNFRYFTNNLD